MPLTHPVVPTPDPIPPVVTPRLASAPEPTGERAPFATDQVIAAFWFPAQPR